MGCSSCGGRTAANNNETLGYYVVLPDKITLLPTGVNPDDPSAGEPPYFSYYEARTQVTTHGGGTIRRLKRKPGGSAAKELTEPSSATVIA